MKLKHATVVALIMTSLKLVMEIWFIIQRMSYYGLVNSLYSLSECLWIISLIIFFAVLLKKQIAAER